MMLQNLKGQSWVPSQPSQACFFSALLLPCLLLPLPWVSSFPTSAANLGRETLPAANSRED
jgi:hypothetical protein